VTEFMSGVAPADRATWERFFESLVYWGIPLDAAVLITENTKDFPMSAITLLSLR